MRIIVTENYEEMSVLAARIVASQIYLKPDSVLGLATGSTPLLMYRELVKWHNEKTGLDFSKATTFNLDEYLGLSPQNENTYHYYMFHNFFDKINICRENIHIPSGQVEDVEKECQSYDAKIKQKGSIDLQILGIGQNGHIGFNEPDIEFEATTHKVKLDKNTIQANARFFPTLEAVPQFAISMGIKTIMSAKKILLLVNGQAKADAISHAIYNKITPKIPASILQLHKDVTIIADKSAASMLKIS